MPLTNTSLPDFDRPHVNVSRTGSSVLATVLTWDFRHRSRHSLGNLPPHLLRDIGLDAITVQNEVAKPFWKG